MIETQPLVRVVEQYQAVTQTCYKGEDNKLHFPASERKYQTHLMWADEIVPGDPIKLIGCKVTAEGPREPKHDVVWFIEGPDSYSEAALWADWYRAYCEWVARYSSYPLPFETALALTCQYKCWYCDEIQFADADSYIVSAQAFPEFAIPVRYCLDHSRLYDTGRPTLEDLAAIGPEQYGPPTPFWILLDQEDVRHSQVSGRGRSLSWYKWDDDGGPGDCAKLGMAQVKGLRETEDVLPEDLLVVTNTTWGDYVGDDVTRNNWKAWTKEYAASEGQLWWTLEGGFDTKMIVVLAHSITEELYRQIKGLDDYGSLDDDGLYETQAEMQEEALNSWGKYDIPPVLRPYLESLLDNSSLDPEARQKYQARFDEICDDAESVKALVWELEYACSQSGGYIEWLYESGTSAVLTGEDIEKLAKALRLSHIIPADDKTQALPFDEETEKTNESTSR
jgi:hypothetical protein